MDSLKIAKESLVNFFSIYNTIVDNELSTALGELYSSLNIVVEFLSFREKENDYSKDHYANLLWSLCLATESLRSQIY
jgi:hypothetical protein